MTFRQNGKLDTSGVSGGGGSGGSGRRGMTIGGGIGSIAIVLLAAVFGVDLEQFGLDPGIEPSPGSLGSSASTQHIDQHISQCTLAQANSDTICRLVATTESLEDVWTAQLPAQTGEPYVHPQTKIFTGGINTACGFASSAIGPFYCPADQSANVDISFFSDVLERKLGGSSNGPSQMYVLAHEFGHHIQNQLGDLQRSQQDPHGRGSGAVRTELQADCYAGLWAHHATRTAAPGGQEPLLEALTRSDIADIIVTAEAIGDDHIQQTSGTRIDPQAWTHGSSEMRREWLIRGYQNGEIAACDTYDASI